VAVQTSINIDVQAARSVTLDQGTSKALHALAEALSWPSGTAASQADEVWSDKRDVAAAANDDLELDSLTQVDADDNTVRSVSFAVIKLVYIRNISTSGRVDVGAAASNPWAGAGFPFVDGSDKAAIPFGGGWLWYDPVGVAVSNGSADVLRIAGVTATQTYRILIIGEAA